MTVAPLSSPAARIAPATSRARWRWPEAVFWLAALAALLLLPDQHLILNEIAILALFALSLDLILGYAGIVSLGHAAFFGLGAYVAGLLTIHASGEPLLGLVAAALAGAALGFATGFLVLRGSDLTRLMVTLGVSLLLFEIANQAAELTGGADGLNGMMVGPILGWFEFDLYGTTAYAYSLAVLFALFLFARRLVHSPFGLSLKAIRDNRLRAAAVGVPVARRLIAIYALSAAYAAVAGALLAQTTQFVSLDVFDFHRSADVLLVLVIGGAGYLYGGPIGAVLFRFLQDWISGLTPQYWSFWLGAFLVLLVLVGRDRLVQGVRRPLAALLSRLGAGR
ncbi:branched-chain amino acid ABC transporter permease [Inquilinus limosus]|uniref:Branched-chain amino acid ABC transporter permease n=1 Tax=Inquilinus limosus TaxID=171674 RepID=A0A211ZSA4_9PROT|nr:branched-chain amino acid ABC transporter permease [Inquilinus limosus]OWJ68084.1 branched-chain amino acid ABC transporter permease [Inquilinus limosus]